MKSSSLQTNGRLVADFLVGSWRAKQAPLDISSSTLDLITELLYNAGGAGLAWWRIHESSLATTASGEFLHQAYRLQALQSAIQEERTSTALGLLREHGIEPILLKGWSLARVYPEPSLRAYGDIDLLVKPPDYDRARTLLAETEMNTWWIDLHQAVFEFTDRSPDDLYERSRLAHLGNTEVRLLCAEDQLALQAIHLFKHGVWRPSWLCDIAALVETLPADFDWELCYGLDRRRASWISSAIALSHALLETNVDDVTFPSGSESPPRWLIDATLKQWGNLLQHDRLPVQPRRQFAFRQRPGDLLRAAGERWPDPIVATFSLNGRMSNLPRFPYQLSAFVLQTTRYLLRNFS